ncbi:hypothetical protein [Streptomyces boncukensis]|uniref:Uncharacterized protein n=1 Tax=Streptomyces boncukensis TaxID=2711219 RepID=A0A6G4WV98_9ACTN|nr:hypothetical protein [Streptomyces boncukensis]NGO68537.1 hypothetical protein [Streptomyces boncukensis]
MSHDEDITVTAMMMRLTLVYRMLRRTSSALPIAIDLPRADSDIRIEQCVAGVARAYEIAREVPMPAEIQGHLYASYLHWLSAVDLIKTYMAFQAEPGQQEFRADAVMFTLQTAESYIGDVDRWLGEEGNATD